MEEKKATLIQHLKELRRVVIISLLSIFVGTMICYAFLMEPLMDVVFGPLERLGKELVMIGVTEGFMVQLKLSFSGGVIIASPVVLWQLIGFILPALYKYEKKLFWVSFLSALVLFTAGLAFGYICVLDIGLRVLLLNFAEGLTPMISASRYLSFFTAFLLPFGLVFQIPLATLLLSRLGIVSPVLLRSKRGYVILVIFLLGAFLSPGGDVFSQILLAFPMLILYEASIWISVLVSRKREGENKNH